MNVVWDANKAAENLRRRGIAFAEAADMFADPYAIRDEDTDHPEWRHKLIGMNGARRLLVAAYTYRGDDIRLISVRAALRREVRRYGRKR